MAEHIRVGLTLCCPTRRASRATPGAHTARVGEPLDAFINDLVIARLSRKAEGDEARPVFDEHDNDDDGIDVESQLTARLRGSTGWLGCLPEVPSPKAN